MVAQLTLNKTIFIAIMKLRGVTTATFTQGLVAQRRYHGKPSGGFPPKSSPTDITETNWLILASVAIQLPSKEA
jgi:hypothetical protein